MSTLKVQELIKKPENLTIEENLAFSTSFGQEGHVMTGLIATNELSIKIFTLDAGRFF